MIDPFSILSGIDDLRAACTTLSSKHRPFTNSDLAMLRDRIDPAIDRMKEAGIPLERAVHAVKTVAVDTGLASNDPAILERLVAWSIERYYGPGTHPS